METIPSFLAPPPTPEPVPTKAPTSTKKLSSSAIKLPHGFELREYQKPLWDAFIHNGFTRGITVWPRRNGKDLTALNLLTALAMQRVGLYLYIGPYYSQTRNIVWSGMDGGGRPFLDYIPRQLVEKKSEQRMEIHLKNGSIIRLAGSDNIDSIVGGNPIGIIFTEFSLHKPEAWHYLRPILAENGGWALFNGTPRGMNHFFTMMNTAREDEKWFTQYLTRDDTGIPSLEAIEDDRRSGMPESLIQQEYYCSWMASSEEICIPLDILEPCTTTAINKEDYGMEPIVMGVDVAYAAKGDKATIAIRQGRMLHPVQAFQGLDNMEFVSQIIVAIREYRPDMVFIDAGQGNGVISRLRQLGYDDIVVPINFGGKPEDPVYANKTTEMWVRTRDWINSSAAPPKIPNDEELIRELSGPMLDTRDDRGKVRIESKARRLTRGISSTDLADAVILTHAGPEIGVASPKAFVAQVVAGEIRPGS